MKNKKYVFAVSLALFAMLLSACAGAVTDTSAQTAPVTDVQTAPDVEASLTSNTAPQNGQAAEGKGRGGRDLTAAAEALGVTVEELQSALQGAVPAECVGNTPDPNGQPQRDPNCRPDLALAAETLGVTAEELQAALGKGGRERDLTAAAETLGVTVEELQQALQDARPAECVDGQPVEGVDCKPDFEAIASALGVTVEELEAALGRKGPDFAAAAETLGVTEEELQQALQDSRPAECASVEQGQPKDPNCRPNIETAAETLGVTVDELQQALGKPEGGHGRNGGKDGQQPPAAATATP